MTHNFSSLSIHLLSTPALLSFNILFNRYLPGQLLISLALNSSKIESLLIGLPQRLAKVNLLSHLLLLILVATLVLSLTNTLLSLTRYLLSLNLVIIIFVNFAVFIFTSNLKLPVADQ